MIIKRLLVSGMITFLLIGCKASDLAVDDSVGNESTPTGVAAPLSNSEYQSLKPEKQYQVANKLAATLFKGIPADEFFDFNSYGSGLKVSQAGNQYLSETRNELVARLRSKDRYSHLIEQRHNLGSDAQKAKAEPLAIIKEYPFSRDQLEAWMAYVLMNTILFSPAEEIDSTNYIDVQRIYDGLLKAMGNDASIRDIILTHMKSQANWRRFRSPEDNTREMIEIYLGLFDRDEDVPHASIACKNWYLTGENNAERYALVIDDSEENSVPQKVLGSWVTTCEDFYTVVANHQLVIPRITTYLVDWFFPNSSSALRSEIVKDIVSKNPVRFHDIFTAIIFSREYLINNEKPKNFEETFFNLAERLDWDQTNTSFLRELAADSNGARSGLKAMGQPTMTLKLGRFMGQPLDSLSFAYYHQTLREQLLTRTRANWGSWGNEFVDKGDLFDTDEYIDFLFLSALSRKASSEESVAIKQVFMDSNNESGGNYRRNQASIVFDYISRLPDLYYFKSITAGDTQ
ncbi:MAG: hypothetical protein OEM38_07610 [Gammaproteobacteria bacterium]|nr:hypothetical protein [Gammaproteobacteria bacterium]